MDVGNRGRQTVQAEGPGRGIRFAGVALVGALSRGLAAPGAARPEMALASTFRSRFACRLSTPESSRQLRGFAGRVRAG